MAQSGGMFGGGGHLAPELLQELEQLAANCSRRQIARYLCQRLDWRGPSGRFQEMSARKLLVQLERGGCLKLPPARPVPPQRKAHRFGEPCPDRFASLRCSLAELGPIEIVLIGPGGGKE